MIWRKEFIYVPQYERTSGMHGSERFKEVGPKQVSVAVLKADIDNAGNLLTLVLLSHHLNVPVHYDFETEPQTAFIKIVGAEDVG